jgi:gluconate 5-dehydrogenase
LSIVEIGKRSQARELGRLGITSNAIAPGFIATDLNADMRANAALDQWVKGRNPLGRWGSVADIAGAAVYRASPAAGFVNGAVLAIDGGMSAVI